MAHLQDFALSISLVLLSMAAVFTVLIVTPRQSERRLINADREALRLTNNPQAALEALERMRQNTAPPSGSRSGQSQEALSIAKRIAAMKKREEAGA